ncbi:MAG: GH92 family glycosyl hydrolase [Bacteroidota bacterium]
MLKPFAFLSICCILLSCHPEFRENGFDPIPFVDPFIGTGFHGHTFPGATTPFGMVQLSPDTRLPGWDASSGYHNSDSTIYGFSHTHLSGTGIGDMGDVLVLPFTGENADLPIGSFDKSSEQASPASYQVVLKNFDIQAELTATTRVGIHRYTFPEGESAKLMIDLGHILQANWGHRSTAGKLDILDTHRIQGERFSSGWAHDHRIYFYAEFSAPFIVESLQQKDSVLGTKQARGDSLRVFLTFPKLDQHQLILKVGISPVSMEGARKNMLAEASGWDFDLIRTESKNLWREKLSQIQITTQDASVKRNFYTALYHSMMAPMISQDVDGKYRGMDKQIHQSPDGSSNYTVFSLWDTFRALHPLMSILDPDLTSVWIRSLLQKYKEGGMLPKWPLASNYTGTMVGYPSTALIADALSKGIDDFDTELALEAAVFSSQYHPEIAASLPEPRASRVMPKHLDYINRMEFVPVDSIDASVSYGLECAYYDWCIAQIAKHEQEESLVQQYSKRATFYQHYFDPEFGLMRGKLANGSWREPFSPRFSDHELGDFVEGNSWQWSWFVPHDIPTFMSMMGGKEAFAIQLDSLFSTSSELEGERASSDITGLIGQYAHGNEPSHHIAHLYNHAGHPHKAQERLDQILQEFYLPEPAGIIGNEDCGQMSAWYVMNALGFYQVCPGEPTYSIGRPMIDQASIRLPGGGMFQIQVINNHLDHVYVDQMLLNGEVLEEPFFPHSAIQDGGVLEIYMSDSF